MGAKVHSRTTYSLSFQGRTFEVPTVPCNAIEYLYPVVMLLPDGRAVMGYLADDEDPQSPRENENLGHMICWHNRYNLGDEEESKQYENPEALWAELLGEDWDAIDAAHDNAVAEWVAANPHILPGYRAYTTAMREFREAAAAAVREKLVEKGYTILPLYLYDHSGITMSTGDFGDPWDSGQVGWIYAGPEDIKRVGCPADKVAEGLKGEVAEYDEYIRGNCYGVCVGVYDINGELLGDEDSCWGYIGDEWAEEALADAVAATHKRLLEEPHDRAETDQAAAE